MKNRVEPCCRLVVVCIGLSFECGCKFGDPAHVAQPQAAAASEMERLRPLVGFWTGEWEAHDSNGAPLDHGTVRNNSEFTLGGEFLVDRVVVTSSRETRSGMQLWAWDPESKQYRTWNFAEGGWVGDGTGVFDPQARVWRGQSRSRNLGTSKRASGEDQTEFVDDDYTRWSYTERDDGSGQIRQRITGSSRRVYRSDK